MGITTIVIIFLSLVLSALMKPYGNASGGGKGGGPIEEYLAMAFYIFVFLEVVVFVIPVLAS